MAALATSAELAALLEHDDLAGSERAKLLLELASGLVRDELGQLIDYVDTDTTIVRPRGSVLLLPELPVLAVDTVTDVATGDAFATGDYYLDQRAGILHRNGGTLWPARVQVVYEHGYPADETPPGLKAIVLRVAARAVYNPGGVVNERAGEWSAGFALPGMDTATAGLYLSPADVRSLDAFRPGA